MKWPRFLRTITTRVNLLAETHPAIQETPRSIALSGHTVDYLLIRKRGRRGVRLKIDGKGMSVLAALSTPLAEIEGMIGKNERWVLKKLGEWSQRRIIPQRWESGATVFFQGAPLKLAILHDAQATHIEQIGDMLHVHIKTSSSDDVCKAVIAWYRKQALLHLAQRAFFFAKLHGLVPPQVFLSSATHRWGSCNSRREVRLSWRLIKANPALIDYVVCHELAHLRHMNHSSAFWREVETMCPLYRELKTELDANDHLYRAF